MIRIYRKHGEYGNKLQALTEHVGDRDIIGRIVIGIEREHATGENIHHITAGGLHNNVANEAGRQRAVCAELRRESRELLLCGKGAEKKEIYALLKAVALILIKALGKVLYVDAAIAKLAWDIGINSVYQLMGNDLGDLREAREDAAALKVAKAALYVMLSIHLRLDIIGIKTFLGKLLYIGSYHGKGIGVFTE